MLLVKGNGCRQPAAVCLLGQGFGETIIRHAGGVEYERLGSIPVTADGVWSMSFRDVRELSMRARACRARLVMLIA